MKSHGTFADLFARENRYLDGVAGSSAETAAARAGEPESEVIDSPITDEPWVAFTAKERVGVALSGGGIRSAAYNIGFLQGLQHRHVLARTSYLSTVSGGGYAGGFWTAWRHRHGKEAPFPTHRPSQPGAAPNPSSEALPLRHLREYSRFLMPRIGLLRTDVWEAIVTILGGFLPSLLASLAVLAATVYGWYLFALCLGDWDARAGGALLGAAMLVYFLRAETDSRRGAATPSEKVGHRIYFVFALVTAGLLVGVWIILGKPLLDLRLPEFLQVRRAAPILSWPPDFSRFVLIGAPFAPSFVLLAVGVLLIFLRVLFSRLAPELSRLVSIDIETSWPAPVDRLIARCLRPALVWAALALIWDASRWIADKHWTAGTGSATVGIGALFAYVRGWLAKPEETTQGSAALAAATRTLKPIVPQILAAAAVILMYTMACILVQKAGLGAHLPWGVGVIAAVLFLTLLLFDPAMVGMHDFYRSRICRCFLGASQVDFRNFERKTDEQGRDDLTMQEMQHGGPGGHLHLVCCAANNLQGDPLASLYRGCRSAVVSPFGVSLGNRYAELNHLRYSSALTASAAAFNSQMGRYSMQYGPAVAFLMSSLNCRLGLWVKHPLETSRDYRVFPGRPFFLEMFGLTKCDPLPVTPSGAAPSPRVGRRLRDLHLSDGGHFENLGLYELVRRHCRYIIVSDCGADEDVICDDLAIALRTIREDFGVEIDLDLSPLRRDANGRAAQHAVVGTIHYHDHGGMDKGTLIYFKPSLTGDEPADITQYQARHPAFPHEPTSDQFYDEAQWESYRCLGQHVAEGALDFVASYQPEQLAGSRFVENLFLDAARFLSQPPERDAEQLLALTERCSEFDADVRDHAPAALRAEFFPEIAATFGPAAGGALTADEAMQTLYYLMLSAQLLENIWNCARLDLYGSHPSNDGWINYFHRWTAMPSFRRWWPFLSPLYSLGFREFVRDRFGVAYHDSRRPDSPGARFALTDLGEPQGLAWDDWCRRRPELRTAAPGRRGLQFLLRPDAGLGQPAAPALQVGLLLLQPAAGATASLRWKSGDLFVPPALSGSGISGRFLDAVVSHFPTPGTCLEVIFEWDPAVDSPSRRQERIHEINFYRSRGFALAGSADADGQLRLVRETIPAASVG